jgi:hypothetical protein
MYPFKIRVFPCSCAAWCTNVMIHLLTHSILIVKPFNHIIIFQQDTSVYMDPWVPGLDCFLVQPLGNVDLTLKVAYLRTASGGWDEEKLQYVTPYCS